MSHIMWFRKADYEIYNDLSLSMSLLAHLYRIELQKRPLDDEKLRFKIIISESEERKISNLVNKWCLKNNNLWILTFEQMTKQKINKYIYWQTCKMSLW